MNKTLIQKFAERFSVDSEKVIDILKATAFRQKAGSAPVTDEQMMALLIVAENYSLNPFTREIYPDFRYSPQFARFFAKFCFASHCSPERGLPKIPEIRL
jgi:hypothetical protein